MPNRSRAHSKIEANSAGRATFGSLSNAALRTRIPEARSLEAIWTSQPNLGWVRWPRADGRFVFCAIRRRLDWITGEIGIGPDPVHVDELLLVTTLADAKATGCRIQLGMLLHGQDKWWSSGGSEPTLVERLDWIAMQMQLRLFSIVSATTPPRAA